ncbi:MAG: hypothetical protein Q4C12_08710 [Clostridia bacterium]|nr:hypothetical protein [Clostridia bacterium]
MSTLLDARMKDMSDKGGLIDRIALNCGFIYISDLHYIEEHRMAVETAVSRIPPEEACLEEWLSVISYMFSCSPELHSAEGAREFLLEMIRGTEK